MPGYTLIEQLEVPLRFERLSDRIWDHVAKWPRFAQNTVGEQLVQAADSVAANIIEGGNREGDPDALRFFSIAKGSAGETSYWLRRAIARNILLAEEGESLLREWASAIQLLSKLINYRRSTRWKVRENRGTYESPRSRKPGAQSPEA